MSELTFERAEEIEQEITALGCPNVLAMAMKKGDGNHTTPQPDTSSTVFCVKKVGVCAAIDGSQCPLNISLQDVV
jgi:hypothetical protein